VWKSLVSLLETFDKKMSNICREVKMRKVLMGLSAVLMTVSLLGGVGALAKEEKVIAWIPSDIFSPYYRKIQFGVQEAGAKRGWKVFLSGPGRHVDLSQHAQCVEDAVMRGVDAMVISTMDMPGLVEPLRKAKEADIKVVIFNDDREFPDPSLIDGIVGYSQEIGQVKMGKHCAWLLNFEGKVGIIAGVPSYYSDQRVDGFMEAIDDYPDIEVVSVINGDWARQSGYRVALDMLQAHPEIDLIMCCDDEMALGAIEAAKSVGRDVTEGGDLIVVGQDGNLNALESIKAGEMRATVDCRPVQMAEMIALQLHRAFTGVKGPRYIDVGTDIVTPYNVDQFITEVKRLVPEQKE
jgi:ABC-type sugar transport system substrate-binding protein